MDNLLSLIADNQPLMDAVKAEILKQFEVDLSQKLDLDNQRLGEVTRATILGQVNVELAFRNIAKCKSVTSNPKSGNPAR